MPSLTDTYLIKTDGAPYTSGGQTRQKMEDAGPITATVRDTAAAAAAALAAGLPSFPTEEALRGLFPSGSDTDSDTDDVLLTGVDTSYGVLLVVEKTGGITGFFRIDGSTVTSISADANFALVKDNAATYNVYYETDQYKIQNKVGDNKSIAYQFMVI